MISLCLAHCEMENDAFEMLANGLISQPCTLKYLNLSWNNLNQDIMHKMCDMLNHIPCMEKLLIQHNDFGAEGAEMLAKTLENHKKI